MKKQMVVIIAVGVIVSFIAGFVLSSLFQSGDGIIQGDRSHLMGAWQGSDSSSSFSLQFYENGSLVFSSYRGNYTVNQNQLVLHNQGITMTAEYVFLNDYNTLGLTNIKSSSSYGFGFFGIPYGIILQRV